MRTNRPRLLQKIENEKPGTAQNDAPVKFVKYLKDTIVLSVLSILSILSNFTNFSVSQNILSDTHETRKSLFKKTGNKENYLKKINEQKMSHSCENYRRSFAQISPKISSNPEARGPKQRSVKYP